MNFYHLSGGQIVEERGQPDFLGLLQQIGAVPTFAIAHYFAFTSMMPEDAGCSAVAGCPEMG